jgi:hypothetical protein
MLESQRQLREALVQKFGQNALERVDKNIDLDFDAIVGIGNALRDKPIHEDGDLATVGPLDHPTFAMVRINNRWYAKAKSRDNPTTQQLESGVGELVEFMDRIASRYQRALKVLDNATSVEQFNATAADFFVGKGEVLHHRDEPQTEPAP